jgi:glycosyltransferase involved in cell wall biosynthesis
MDCVNSILGQSLNAFDLIVLDNCSTDGTTEWVESLHDRRVRLYRSDRPLSIEENWARARNVPRGEFMTLIGHDDVLLPTYLQEMEALIQRHPAASLYQAHFQYIDGRGDYLRSCLPMDEVQYAHEFLACHMARTMESMGTGYMMRSSDYDRVGGMPVNFPNLIFADYALWIDLTRLGYKATTLEELFLYRIHNSLSRSTNGMVYQEAFGKYVDFIASLIPEDPSIRVVVNRYGKEMLLYYCESLSHRLLKTPVRQRSLKVGEYIDKCCSFARVLIPDQAFDPMRRFRIRIADRLDRSLIGRELFLLYKKCF